jgi:proline racemase/trans-L-3-hydroxyproline dehydratase
MGEPTRVVIGGMRPIPGKTMAEKREFLKTHFDHIRTALMLEPRGHNDMFGSILMEPTDPQADLGIVFMDGAGYMNMCVHGTIGAVTVALEMGLLELKEPLTQVTFDTPSGLVFATAETEEGIVRSVRVENVPSFLYREGVQIDIPGLGAIPIDIAFGGNFFALVDNVYLRLKIVPENVGKIVEAGMSILRQVNREVEVSHPTKNHLRSVDLVEIHELMDGLPLRGRNAVVFGGGQVDRSPCGTGTCAKMATLFAKGKLGLEEDFIQESIIGTAFSGRLLRQTVVGDIPAVIPEIKGQAFITGIQQFVIDPADPLKYGFRV